MIANIFANLMGGLVDQEKIANEKFTNALNEVLAELNEGRELEQHYSSKDFFVTIKPIGHKIDQGQTEVTGMKFYIYLHVAGLGAPKYIREITLKEILGIESEG